MTKLILIWIVVFVTVTSFIYVFTKKEFMKMTGNEPKTWKLIGDRTNYIRLVFLLGFLISAGITLLIKWMFF